MDAVELLATNLPQPLVAFAIPVLQVEYGVPVVLVVISNVVPGVQVAAFTADKRVAPLQVAVCACTEMPANSNKAIDKMFSVFQLKAAHFDVMRLRLFPEDV